MLNRLLEHFLISTFNRSRDRREKQAPSQPASTVALPVVPPEYTIVGHLLPSELPPADAIAQRLSDAGVVALSPEARLRHLYVLGATGTGKTNLLLRLIESDIHNRRAFCVFDLRGDLVDRVMLRLAALDGPQTWRERLVLMDLRDTRHAVGFNPLAGDGEVHARALHLLSVLKTQSESWGVQLEETLRNALLALAESNWTLLEVEPLLTDARFRAGVLQQVSDTRVRAFFSRYDALSQANQTTWALSVLNKVTPLLSVPTMRHVFGQRQSLSWPALVERQPGLIVLVALAADRLHEAARLAGGLMVSSLQTAIMARADRPEHQRVPLHLYIDEFESMASERFESIVAEGRRFGLGLTLSHQNLSQLSSGLRHVVRNNVHTQIYFQTGALDAAELAKEVTDSTGEDVKAALMAQGVGQAYLVRRGQPSARMQVLHCPDPHVSMEQVRAIREASLATYARPSVDVERELLERDRSWSASAAPDDSDASNGTAASTETRPTYEIRHAKAARFKPEPATANPETDAPTPDTAAPDTSKRAASPPSTPPAESPIAPPIRKPAARRVTKPKVQPTDDDNADNRENASK